MYSLFGRLFFIASSICMSLVITIEPQQSAIAQVTPDGTLTTTVISSDNLNFVIEDGEQLGTNLFHSFKQFSVPTNGSAIFNNVADIENIFSRVTGNDISDIDGLIQANGSANLFLINPNGIVFGPNASLNMGGSFLATAATEMIFEDNSQFSAVNDTPPLLTISTPVGLNFVASSASIDVQNDGHTLTQASVFSPVSRASEMSSLAVANGQTLALVGNDITLDGGMLLAESGHIELAAIEQGNIEFNMLASPWMFTDDRVEQFGDITLRNRTLVDASQLSTDSDRGGTIGLRGRDIRLEDASVVLVQNLGTQTAGTIHVQASRQLDVLGTNPIGDILTGFKNQTIGQGTGGNIELHVANLQVAEGAEIEAATYGIGNSGNILIEASDTIDIMGFSQASPDSSSTISTITVGAGDAGDIDVVAHSLNIRNGGNLTSFNFFNPEIGGSGDAGSLNIRISEKVEILGDNPITQVPSSLTAVTLSNANGGNLSITTPRLIVQDGGRIGTTTFADGDAGDLTINATESIELNGVGSSEFNPSLIIASANILDPFLRELFGLPDLPSGQSGRMSLWTPYLSLANGARLTVQNEGIGDSGDMSIMGRRVVLQDNSFLTASTQAGTGGNIQMNVDSVFILQNGSQLSSEAGGLGNGGNISIDATNIIGLNNSDISANAFEGNGGNVEIRTQGLFGLEFRDRLTPKNDITASSAFGLDGSVEINNPEVDPSSRILELPDSFVDLSQLVQSGCALDAAQFALTGRGGLPANPQALLNGDRPWFDLRDPSAFLTNPSDPVASSPAAQPVILESPQEATEMAIAPNGAFQLIASQAQNAVISHATCMSQANRL